MQAVLSKMSKGITVCYSELFPDSKNEYFHLAYMGKIFVVADSYCMNLDCTCREAALHFVQAYPRERLKSDSFMIKYKLNGRGFKIHEQGKFNRRDIQNIVRHFTADDTILNLLNARFMEMRGMVKEILG